MSQDGGLGRVNTIQREVAGDGGVGPLALYVHIPFCETKCPYCDFNTYAGIEALMPSYVEAMKTEVTLWGHLLGRPGVETVFFGGGTPSYLLEHHMSSAMDAVRSAFVLSSDAEVTLEANPDDVTAAKSTAWIDCGVNRVSIGVQSFDDRLLKALGRRHSATQAATAYRVAVEAGFQNLSIDLMYGLPDQSVEDWRRTLEVTIDLDPPHVSMYCLTLEQGTPMERWIGMGELSTPDPDLAADMYLMAEEAMERGGYQHYEISNWARPGFESRHNLTYWRNQPYLGVGPGAHSYLAGFRFFNLQSPREYVRRLRKNVPVPAEHLIFPDGDMIKGVPVVRSVEPIDHRLEMAETLMLGLRLDTGVDVEEFARRFGAKPSQVYGNILAELSSLGLLRSNGGRLMLTDRGRLLGNEVFSRFFV